MSDEGIPPPHDPDAEAAVVSACLVDPKAFTRVADFLKPEHFYSGAHAAIMEGVEALYGESREIDVTTVAGWLRSRGWIARVGGMGYLTEVLNSSPAIANVRDHGEIVFDKWRLRQLKRLGEMSSALAMSAPESQPVIDQMAHDMIVLARNQSARIFKSNKENLEEILGKIILASLGKYSEEHKLVGIPTGIGSYDRHTSGLHAGHVTVLSALPRVGKTSLAIQTAIEVARHGIGVLFFSTEMSREEVGRRQMAYLAGIDSNRIMMAEATNSLSVPQFHALVSAVKERGDLPIILDDRSSMTVDDICSGVKQQIERAPYTIKAPLGLVIIDYIQRLTPSLQMAKREKHIQIADAARKVKNLAADTQLAILELSQLRDYLGAKKKAPTMSDAGADCSDIVKEAHNVVLMYRKSENSQRDLLLHLAKCRTGPEAFFPIHFECELSRFSEAQ